MTASLTVGTRRAAVFASAFALSMFAVPQIAHAAPGTVKIRDVDNPKNSENANDPKVCRFQIIADGFTAANDGDVRYGINPEGDTDQPTLPFVRSGSISVDGDGNGASGTITLPDGRYKVFVQNAQNDASISNGGSKKKVFTVDCPAGGPGNPTPTPGPGGGGGGSDDDDEVGGVGNEDEDDGTPGVGGVGTGGGGLANPTNVDVAFPLLITALGGAFVAATTRRRNSE